MSRTWFAFWIPALVTACLGGDSTGRLTLAITDAPVDGATAVVVEFTGVEIKPAGGDAVNFDFDAPRQIDLLALTGTDSDALLDGVEVPAGMYDWVRLKVNATADGVTDSYIDLKDGTRHELDIPSGSETGLKLVSGFAVPAGGAASFTIDFDLRKSVHQPMSGSDVYVLRPALRVVDNTHVGAIAGTVDASLITATCSPAVYVFPGSGVTPDDVDNNAPDPVTTAIVKLNSGDGLYEYTAGFLTAGAYTVTFTCDAAGDDPDTDDTLVFSGTQSATVVADQTTTVNFGP